MEAIIPSTAGVDFKLQALRENVESLRGGLRYWRSWEAEYEGLKEEIEKLGEQATAAEMQSVASDFGGDILTPRECQEILNASSKSPRNISQVISVISRRMDYVQENIKSLQKRMDASEAEIASLEEPAGTYPTKDDVLQFQEITEVLDDDDNVVSSSVTDASASAPEILEALRKSGVKGLPDLGKRDPASRGKNATSDLPESRELDAFSQNSRSIDPPEPKISHMSEASAANALTDEEHRTHATDVETENSNNGSNVAANYTGILPEDVDDISHDDFPQDPIIPDNETSEEAAIRREMLQYNMNEMGAIVATMNLEDPTVGIVSDNDLDEDDEDDESDSDGEYDGVDTEDHSDCNDGDEPEDKYGRATTRVIDEEYRKEMLELEERLKARAFVNVGPNLPYHLKPRTNPSSESSPISEPHPKDSEEPHSDKSVDAKNKKQKKAVRFADNLDIAAEDAVAIDPSNPHSRSSPTERPITENIVERNSSSGPVTESLLPAKRSRGSSSLLNTSQAKQSSPRSPTSGILKSGPLSGMQGTLLKPLGVNKPSSNQQNHISDSILQQPRTHSNVIIERSSGDTSENVKEPDEYDPSMTREQLALEYQRARERFIRKHGKPTHDEEDDEMQDLNGKRLSKFKAARLSKIAK